jgi:tetratricopeptide (TPR) repeat protein
LGVVLLHDGAPGEAQKHLEASVSLDATSHGAAKYLGDAYAVMCEHDKAIASYRRALELNPHWPAALAPLVESYLERGGEGDAAVALPLAWDLCEQSKHADVHDLLLLAKAYVAAERPDKARETAASALALARETGVREQVSLFLESLPTH